MIVNPAVDSYEALEKAGNLLVLAVYKNDRLIGYSSTFLFKNFHYADLFYAQNDLLFIAKEHRDSLIGLRLIRATETKAKERGAQMMLWHAKENTPLASILERMKYRVQDIIFSKEL
jgi:predicted GNAT superfamily acetyltransferase